MHGDRRLLCQGAGERPGIGHQLAGFGYPGYQTYVQRLFGSDPRAKQEHLQCPGPADESRQSLSPAPAGYDTEVDLRLPEHHPLSVHHYPEVTGHRQFASTPEGESVDGGYDGLWILLDVAGYLLSAGHGSLSVRRACRLDVEPRRESPVSGAGDDHRSHCLVRLPLGQHGIQLVEYGQVNRVGRWPVKGDNSGKVLALYDQILISHEILLVLILGKVMLAPAAVECQRSTAMMVASVNAGKRAGYMATPPSATRTWPVT